MGKRLPWLVILLLAMMPSMVLALGLGPITMRSSLNQPLNAEIDIHSAQKGDLKSFKIKLASPEDFQRVNVERSPFLTRIKFQLKYRANGTPYILLTTREPVSEPYLDFLVEARWPRGRSLKEYTVLVDPPVLSAESPAPVQPAEPVFSQPRRQAAPSAPAQSEPRQIVRRTPSQTQSPSASQPREQVSSRPVPTPTAPPPVRRPPPALEGELNYGEVQRGDTLWKIASEMRPDESVSVQQMMLAFLRDNPNAFYGGNINQLKAGFVLRIKDADTLRDLGNRDAIDEVRRQNLAWRESRSSGRLVRQADSGESGRVAPSETETGRGVEVDEPKPAAEPKQAAKPKERPRVKIGAAGDKDSVGQGSSLKQLQQEITTATETLDAKRQESEELGSRLAELEEQLQSMQRLIMLKDEELLALQNQQVKNEKAAAEKPKAKEAAKTKKAPADAGMEVAEDEGILSVLTDFDFDLLADPLMLGALGVLVVAVVGWMVFRRRRMQDGFQESILNVGMAHQAASNFGPASGLGATSMRPAESAMVSNFSMSGMDGVDADATEVDPISEADVYLAYGRHQQAEDIIKQAIDKTPDRLDLRAKLLEIFHAAKDSAGFEEQARLYLEHLGGDESNSQWQEIVPMGKEVCPNSELFGGAGGGDLDMDLGDDILGGVSSDDEDLLDFDFDSNDVAMESTSAASADDGLDFDMSGLDLDMDSGSSTESAPAAAEDNSLDFDMAMDSGGSDTLSLDSTMEVASEPAVEDDDGGLDFNLDFESSSEASSDTGSEDIGSLDFDTGSDDADDNSLDFSSDDGGLDFSSSDDDGSLDFSSDDGGLDFDQGLDLAAEGGADADADMDEAFAGMGDDLDEDLFNNVDEIGTKLDLAKAYVDMGDSDGARSILDEVMEEGDDSQRQQAEELLHQMA